MALSDYQQLTLMNRTHPVCTIEYDTRIHKIARILKYYDNGTRGPIGLARMTSDAALNYLSDWWGARTIPDERPNLEEALQIAGISSPAELAFRTHGLSLSDQYWMKGIDEDISWQECNFFNNPFSDELGRLIMRPDVESKSYSGRMDDPANTSDGILPKRWIIIDGARSLIKGSHFYSQEPFNEVIATHLHSTLLADSHFVPYYLYDDDGQIMSVCPNMLADNEELIAASQVNNAVPFDISVSKYLHFLKCCQTLNVKEVQTRISEMIVCDYIIANYDRHWRNFGIIRNVDSLECRMAPIFDSGSCLWNRVRTLGLWEKGYHSKPFEPVPEQQLALVSDWDWYDSDTLNPEEFAGFIKTTLSKGPFSANQIRVDFIADYVYQNINTVVDFKAGKRDHPALLYFK